MLDAPGGAGEGNVTANPDQTGAVLRRALIGGLVGTAGVVLALFALMNAPGDSPTASWLLYFGRTITGVIGAGIGVIGLRLAFRDFL